MLLLALFTRRRYKPSAQVRQLPNVYPLQWKPTTLLTPIIGPLPFANGEMDILGSFPKATGQHKNLFVVVDYFTKWAKAEVIASIIAAKVRKFIWKNIITCFGILRAMIFYNSRQFDTSKVTDYVSTLGCQARFTTVAHPQTNSQAKATNNVILRGLQKKLGDAKYKWADELHRVLWSIRTIEKTVTEGNPLYADL